ncbi:STAS domain-containing protein [Psychrobacillus sp. OK032]|uniref:STAS domain-containing protein n=1 Tax=Psychrobacillus sp. OK032 TaxID=1884358 RepID=UPI0008D7E717|nr:STAS domain-containing protein [Psychrobacillus sp. OK032]SER69155.1 rsbT co-antagonist protein RsbR [Psychrobacillus sp. OK032]
MNSINEQLYEYLIDNSRNITERWFAEKDNFTGAFYSNNSNPQIDDILLEQHALTIKTVASAFIEDKGSFEEQQVLWAETVAKSKIENNTPIHEVIEDLNKTRETIWGYVGLFTKEHDELVTKTNIIKWSVIFNTAYDQLVYLFSERYYELSNNRMTAQQFLINELSTPVIPILESVGVLPIVGDIDTNRAQSLLQEVPQKCSVLGIEQLFIDISAVSIMDTMVANEMFQLIEILNLLGIKTYMSGIRPEIAQTSIQLGLDFSSISTFSSLKQALFMTGVYKNI